jgi:phage repressor protein C with HTH and peptisase S24 domain
MNDFPTRYAEMMKALGLSKNADFARLLGVEPQNVHNWVKVRQRIGGDSRLLFQKRTGISFDWLNEGVGFMWLPSREHPHPTYPYPADSKGPREILIERDNPSAYSDNSPVKGYVHFGLMEGAAAAGYGSLNEEFPEVFQKIDMAEWKVRQQLGFIPATDRVKLLTVRGDSHYPKIKDGDVVMVDTDQTTFAGDGFYVISLNGFGLIKRMQIMSDGMHLISTNKEYASEVIPAAKMHGIKIEGRIVGCAQLRRSEEI